MFEDFHLRRELDTVSTTVNTNNLLYRSQITKNLQPPAYSGLYALSSYTWPVDKMIMDLKFSGKTMCANILAAWFAQKVGIASFDPIDLFIPIPLSNMRFITRQYNQSALLAQHLSKEFDIPVLNALSRKKWTSAQATLSRQGRFENVANAFSISSDGVRYLADNSLLKVNHVALIDDVLTTGSTLNAACDALLQHTPDLQISVIVMALGLTKEAT